MWATDSNGCIQQSSNSIAPQAQPPSRELSLRHGHLDATCADIEDGGILVSLGECPTTIEFSVDGMNFVNPVTVSEAPTL